MPDVGPVGRAFVRYLRWFVLVAPRFVVGGVGAAFAQRGKMLSLKRVVTLGTGCVMLGLWLGGCGSVALQPSGTAGTDGGAAGAAGGTTGGAGSGPAGHGGGGGAGHAGAGGSAAAGSPGTVTLRLALPASTSFCDVSCGDVAPHITILTIDKKPVPTQPPACVPLCAANCQAFGCPQGGACLLTGVAVTSAELKWDGSTYQTSTCGAGISCYQPTIAPAGKYIARMCATPGKLSQPTDSPPVCTATGVQSCTDVVFAFPSGGIVQGSLSGVAPTCGVIRASDYDQSCKVDSDCVAVSQGDLCQLDTCAIYCPSDVISAHVQMQYDADYQSANYRSPGTKPVICSCPESKPPVCANFKCAL